MTEQKPTAEKPRWEYRFTNFKRAYFLLQEAGELYSRGDMEQIAKEGMIQRFEFCMELAWKTLKDYMEHQNFQFATATPAIVIREAYAMKIIADGEGWMDALDARNKMSHTYDFKKFERVLEQINARYLACFGELYEKLAAEVGGG